MKEQSVHAVKAETTLDEFNQYFNTRMTGGTYTITIGGLVELNLGRFPRLYDSVHLEGMHFEIIEVNRIGITRMLVTTDTPAPHPSLPATAPGWMANQLRYWEAFSDPEPDIYAFMSISRAIVEANRDGRDYCPL